MVASLEGQFRSIWGWSLLRGNLEVFGVVSLEGQFRSIWWWSFLRGKKYLGWSLLRGNLEVFVGGLS